MNAVEIEEAISQLADQPFDPENFPYAFLEAFGNKETTIKRLRAGASNKSDLGGVLQTNNIHIATCDTGQVTQTLTALKESPATAKAKAKFILATDGVDFEAEELASGETVACAFKDFPDHFGFFLPLAGITTVRQITENAFDIRATSRLNRLYVALLKDNPEWGTAGRRHDMNHFMARLIFCFFAEDTGIFNNGLFTSTVEQMSARDSSNTHDVVGELFRAMNTKKDDRAAAGIPRWADAFPFVNGGLFSGTPGFDYGEGGYDPNKCNVGFNEQTGQFQIEIKGLAEPKSKEATRICQEDLNEVIAAFVQDKTALERGMFDEELVPEELTQVRMGKIIKDKYPELDEEDQEAVRQHAIAALNLTQQAKQLARRAAADDAEQAANTALIDGVRRFAMDVRELDIDLIDRINPFGEAYAILAKTMSEDSLKQVAAVIAAKRTSLTPEEAKELAVRAFRFKKERGRLPSLTSQDAWERRMAEGAAAFVRYKDEGRYE